jgi:3-phosphoglycerate kinase
MIAFVRKLRSWLLLLPEGGFLLLENVKFYKEEEKKSLLRS